MSVYVQIGAGAGDLDSRANFKDSFTEHIKKLKKETIEEILALDVEGMDADIILDTEWKQINCSNICFEVLHLGDNINNVKHHLNQSTSFTLKTD